MPISPAIAWLVLFAPGIAVAYGLAHMQSPVTETTQRAFSKSSRVEL